MKLCEASLIMYEPHLSSAARVRDSQRVGITDITHFSFFQKFHLKSAFRPAPPGESGAVAKVIPARCGQAPVATDCRQEVCTRRSSSWTRHTPESLCPFIN